MIMITKNAIQCKNCGDVIESRSRNRVVKCSCGKCTVDGGVYYLKRTGDYVELAETQEIPDPE